MTSRRTFLQQSAAGLWAVGALGRPRPAPSRADAWRIQRLSWAGIRLETGDVSLFVDPLISPDIWEGAWKEAVITPTADAARRFILVTHAHNDHFDPAAARQILGERGSVVCHEEIATYVASRGFKVVSVRHYEPRALGDATVAAVPAVDGFGEPQVSWIVSYRGRRVLHGGDTLWHGGWWAVGREYGPIDTAFLPINGARIPTRTPDSGVPAVMTPDQAVAAGVVMGARMVVPIHYGLNDPGNYEEIPGCAARFLDAAKARGLSARVVSPGEWLELPLG